MEVELITIGDWKQQAVVSLSTLYVDVEAKHIAILALEKVTGLNHTQQMINAPRLLEEEQVAQLTDSLKRLMQSEPIQYITGKAYFHDYVFKVTPAVLIPRQETEELVERILKEQTDECLRVLDIGTGSGCIPLTLKGQRPQWEIYGLDVSEAALEVAQENAHLLDVGVNFVQGDILVREKWPALEQLDIIVSNPPYVLNSDRFDMQANVVEHEPHEALFVPDDDPLLFYKAIAAFAADRLQPNGVLYLEIHEEQGAATKALLEARGWEQVVVMKDLSEKDRMVKAQYRKN